MASHQPQPAGFTLSTEDEEQNSKESSARTSYDWDLLYDSQRYTSEERELIQVSETEISRVCVYNMNGRKCTVAGYNRTKGDFTLPSNLLVVDLMDKDKHWIREPDPFDDPIDIMMGWFVPIKGKVRLMHLKKNVVNSKDTGGMYPEGMILAVDSSTREEIQQCAEEASRLSPGILSELIDDIVAGESPRNHRDTHTTHG